MHAGPQQQELQQALTQLEAGLALEDILHYRALARRPPPRAASAPPAGALEASLRGRQQAAAAEDQGWEWLPSWLGGPKPAPSGANAPAGAAQPRDQPSTSSSAAAAVAPGAHGASPFGGTRRRRLSQEDLEQLHDLGAMLGLDAATSEGAEVEAEARAEEEAPQYDPAYVAVRASATMPALSAALYGMDSQGLVEVVLRGVSAALRLRPHRSGMGLQLSARRLELLHLDAPTPHLVPCIAPEPGAEGQDMISTAIEIAPLHSVSPFHMHAEVRPIRLIFNPEVLACFLQFFILPPSHYAASLEFEQVAATGTRAINTGLAAWLGGMVYDRSARQYRPVHVSIHVHDIRILWVEPPAEHRELAAVAAAAPAAAAAAPTVGEASSSSSSLSAAAASAAAAGPGRHLVWPAGAEHEPRALCPHALLLRTDIITIESDPEPPAPPSYARSGGGAAAAPPPPPPADHGFTFGGKNARVALLPPIDAAAWLRGDDEAEACVAVDGWCIPPVDGWVRVAGHVPQPGGGGGGGDSIARRPHVLMDIWTADGERSMLRVRLREEQASCRCRRSRMRLFRSPRSPTICARR